MLSEEDARHLRTLRKKFKLIQDRVEGVARDYHSGLIIWGDGGTGKSFTVLTTLKRLRKGDYVLHNGRLTGRGLVDRLEELPASIHVTEDCEQLFGDKNAVGVLRSALWSQCEKRPMEREVTWMIGNQPKRFLFTGGIIVTANCSLDNTPELAALQTRIAVLHHAATFAETAALIRHLALKGFTFGADSLTPAECSEVAEFIVGRGEPLHRPLDIRIYKNALRDYIQHKNGHSIHSWQSLVESSLRQSTSAGVESRTSRVNREGAVAAEIANLPGLSREQQAALWAERTGRSRRTFFRALQRHTI